MSTKNKIYIFSIILALYSSNINAQVNIGIDAGTTSNKLNYKTNNILLGQKSGYITNINVEYALNKWLSLEGSTGAIQKNYSISNKSNISQQINNTYLQFPISIKHCINVIRRLNASVSLGVYYAYWISSNTEGVAPNVFDLSNNKDGTELIKLQSIKYPYQFDSSKDNRNEFGYVVKAGFNYKIISRVEISIRAHYYQSITDQQKKMQKPQNGRYNQTFAVTAGLTYHF
ncbi:MAG: outer membrane beta-barrel protein [Sphingobacteriaceae bacterium]|nr:outer membrane beta-barrel protein [Sphingobacteriaceae bacterium]